MLSNLRRLLNSRRGLASAQLDYGIPDFCDLAHDFPEGISVLHRGIKAAIERYEPRLRQVVVKTVDADDPLTLCFEISARLIGEETHSPVRLQTRIDKNGVVAVER